MNHIVFSQWDEGGQVLRTSLTTACLTQTPVWLTNIRHGRPKPGLQARHLQAVRAAATISNAKVRGAKLGSESLFFEPGPIQPGDYHFDIGPASASTHILQTIFLPLCFAGGVSHVAITGGINVPGSPSYYVLAFHWLPCLRQMGVRASMHLDSAGSSPSGTGQIRVEIHPIEKLAPIRWPERGELLGIRGLSGVANLPAYAAQRQRDRALTRLPDTAQIKLLNMPMPSPVSMLLLLAKFERGRGCFLAWGGKGRPPEEVADEAVNTLQEFMSTSATMDQFLADQLILPCLLSNEVSVFRTPANTTHHLYRNVSASHLNRLGDIVRRGINWDQTEVLPYHVMRLRLNEYLMEWGLR